MTSAAFALSSERGVLVASSSDALRKQFRGRLQDERWPVHEALGGADALAKLETGNWQVLFLDRRLPDLDAEELILIIKAKFPGIEVVLIDSESGTDSASPTAAAAVLGRWLDPEDSGPSGLRLCGAGRQHRDVSLGAALPGMIGSSPGMQRLYRLSRLVAARNTTVLILGATGTGKELVAQAIHRLSPRGSHPLVVVNCAAIPESLLESELFGYARGAFTGAVQSSPGRIVGAQGGTLFLDEIGELPLGLQAKLLRFLDHKEIQRLGSTETIKIDVRVVAATHRDLAEMVGQGRFREDLYYRIAAFPLYLPPLSERAADIQALAEHFLRMIAAANRIPVLRLHPDALRILRSHSWRGNVRELSQIVERAVILAEDGGTVLPEHLYFCAGPRGMSEVGHQAIEPDFA